MFVRDSSWQAWSEPRGKTRSDKACDRGPRRRTRAVRRGGRPSVTQSGRERAGGTRSGLPLIRAVLSSGTIRDHPGWYPPGDYAKLWGRKMRRSCLFAILLISLAGLVGDPFSSDPRSSTCHHALGPGSRGRSDREHRHYVSTAEGDQPKSIRVPRTSVTFTSTRCSRTGRCGRTFDLRRPGGRGWMPSPSPTISSTSLTKKIWLRSRALAGNALLSRTRGTHSGSVGRGSGHCLAHSHGDRLHILVIKGSEITRSMPPGHLNAIFLENVADVDQEGWRDAVRAAIDQGGFVFWNQSTRKLDRSETLTTLS